MMHPRDHNKYFIHKIALLKRFLNISEEFLSNLEDWESYEDHLAKRDAVIDELQELDKTFGNEVIRSCSYSQRQEIDRMINLVLAVDKDIAVSIDKSRQQTLESMKTTIMEKKITGYVNPVTAHGNFFDHKW